MRQKLKRRAGETLVESLASLLIISLALVMLAGAIIAAGRVNRAADGAETFAAAEVTVKKEDVAVSGNAITVRLALPDDGRLYYYEYEAE